MQENFKPNINELPIIQGYCREDYLEKFIPYREHKLEVKFSVCNQDFIKPILRKRLIYGKRIIYLLSLEDHIIGTALNNDEMISQSIEFIDMNDKLIRNTNIRIPFIFHTKKSKTYHFKFKPTNEITNNYLNLVKQTNDYELQKHAFKYLL